MREVVLDNGNIRLIHGDCLEFLPTLAPGSVDAVVTDPPYGIGFKYNQHDDSPEGYGPWLWSVMLECERTCKPGSPLFVWQGMPNCRKWAEWFPRDYRLFAAAKNFVQLRNTAMQHAWDPVLVWWTEGERFKASDDRTRRDFQIANTAQGIVNKSNIEKAHPCPRPLDQVRYIVDRFTRPRGTVLDCFAGSATTAIAAVQTGRGFIGCEIDERYFNIALRRVEECLGKGSLFDTTS